jgi:exodeoxyribonuclease VII large subunit
VIRTAAEKIVKLESALRILDPAGVMRRGFTLTSRNGLIIHSASESVPGDIITTHFEKGKVISTVKNINSKK